ncbi:MAG: flagellar basal body-associated FliL family protein [Kineosporiaceae bacterium]|nr:flagellar basal body-associated FliL family protein [Kineosporiaceae bacterium]
MADKDEKKDDAAGGGGKKKLIIIIALVAVLGGAAFFFLKPGGDAAASPTPTPTVSHAPGPIIQLEPITINLAGGHFLKLGMALQASAEVTEEVSGAKALDAAIELFSNKTIDELATVKGREKAKEKLVEEIAELYEDQVYDLYFTEFVMQ